MKRIVVYGVTGSGKSTMARQIAQRLGLPCHEVDELTWEPGWVAVAPEVQRDRLRDICAGDAWVLDSMYGQWSAIVLDRADLIVGLDYPRWLSLWRLVRRTVVRIVRRTEVCNGNRESWRGALLEKDSILLWHFRSFTRKRHRMRQFHDHPDFPETVLLASPADARRWLESIG